MGEKKTGIADVACETGVNRGAITRLYHETKVRIELDALEKLCELFDRQVGDLFEYRQGQ